jgi:hypothetical protein
VQRQRRGIRRWPSVRCIDVRGASVTCDERLPTTASTTTDTEASTCTSSHTISTAHPSSSDSGPGAVVVHAQQQRQLRAEARVLSLLLLQRRGAAVDLLPQRRSLSTQARTLPHTLRDSAVLATQPRHDRLHLALEVADAAALRVHRVLLLRQLVHEAGERRDLPPRVRDLAV